MSEIASPKTRPQLVLLRPAYDARLARFAWLTAVTGLLALVTLGIYRFWGRTRVRRYLWSRISVAGDRLEYTGTGREMFLGFLRVALLFAGLALLGKVLDLAADGAGAAIGTLQSLVLAALYLAVPYFSRRYRLSRTRWRAIAFGLSPCLGAYVWCRIRYGLLTAFTLGLLAPLDRIETEAVLIRNARFGDRAFSCTPRIAPALGWWASAWLLILIALAIGGVVVANASPALTSGLSQKSDWAPLLAAGAGGLVWLGAAGILVPLAGVCYVMYRLTVQRVIVDGTRCGPLQFSLRISYGAGFLIGLGQAVATIVAAIVIFGIPLALWVTHGTAMDAGSLAWLAPLALLFLMVMRWISDIAWTHLYLARQIPRLSIAGTDDLAVVGRSTLAGPSRGDGLAGYFDFAT